MRQFEQDWLGLGRRVACGLHYQHPRNLRLVQAAQTEYAVHPLSNGNAARQQLPARGPSMAWMLFGFLTDRGVLDKTVRHRLNRDDGHQANAALPDRAGATALPSRSADHLLSSHDIAREVLVPKPPVWWSGLWL